MERAMSVLFRHSWLDATGEVPREQLVAVADAEDGHAQLVDRGIDGRAGGLDDARRTAGDDDAARGAEGGGGSVDVGDGGVDAKLTDPAGDEVAVLATGVENDDLAHGAAAFTADAPASGPAGRPCPPS